MLGIEDDASWEIIDSDSGEIGGNSDTLWVDVGADMGTSKWLSTANFKLLKLLKIC